MHIICCGNPERGDDGAGVLLARRLRDSGIEADVRTGEALELIAAWSGATDVIVVDAVVTGAPSGTVQRWGAFEVVPVRSVSTSTHRFSVAEAIELGRTLGNLPERLRVYGIEGRQFAPGTRISTEVERAVDSLAQEITAEALGGQPHSPAGK
jgi:hydrogenase maturation protease